MEMRPLSDFIKSAKNQLGYGSQKNEIQPWYNSVGDYIEFQTINEGFIADRIDDFLTVYRAVDDNRTIGFKIKDVQALVQKVGADAMAVKCQTHGTRIVSIGLLLLAAYEEDRPSIGRREGYVSAMEALREAPAEMQLA